LVDADVDDDRPGLHGGYQVSGDQPGRSGPGKQDRPHQDIGALDLLFDGEPVAHEGLDVRQEPLEVVQTTYVDVEDGHLGAHARGDEGRVEPGDAAAQYHHLGRRHAGGAA
jgi:hypothetical protein